MKSCIYCIGCQFYKDELQSICNELYSFQQTVLRNRIAELCKNYEDNKNKYKQYGND